MVIIVHNSYHICKLSTLGVYSGQKNFLFALNLLSYCWMEKNIWKCLDKGKCHGIGPEKDGNIGVLKDVARDNTSPSSQMHNGPTLPLIHVIPTVYNSSCEVGDEQIDEKS